MSPEEANNNIKVEKEQKWEDCEVPENLIQNQQEEIKAEEDPKTLPQTADIMSPTKLRNVEESGYIGAKSNDEP